jgi:hypothetical protein
MARVSGKNQGGFLCQVLAAFQLLPTYWRMPFRST